MHKLAEVADIPEGKAILVHDQKEREIALFKVKGEIFALDNLCPHMGGPLAEGEIDGTCLTCPWHGWQFDVRSGECENMPGDNVEKIQIVVENGSVYLVNS